MGDDVRPFSSGSEYGDWTANNCGSCDKAAPEDGSWPTCEIEAALVTAYVGEGTIPLPMYDRMGRHGACREHSPPFVNVRADGTVDPSVPRPIGSGVPS